MKGVCMRSILIVITTFIAMSGIQTMAQDKVERPTTQAQDSEDLRAKVQNPISSLISLPFKFNFDYGAPNGEASFLNIQPVVPVTVGDWNLANRAIIPLIDNPGEVAGTLNIPNPIPGEGATGLGDINYSLFLSPVKYKNAIWGIGPSITLPSATDDQLGSGKWSTGPTGDD
jgi:hypothetical protein